MSVFDLSKFQPVDRIQNLVEQGNCDGVILKLGERNVSSGEIELDPRFISHVNEAVRFNLPYGVYLMSRANDGGEAMQEAMWINDRVAELLNGTEPSLGTWFDLERPETKRDGIWADISEAIRWLSTAWNNSQKIGIYGSYSYLEDYIGVDNLISADTPIWLAQYGDTNSIKDNYPQANLVAWQFSTHNNSQDENNWYGFSHINN